MNATRMVLATLVTLGLAGNVEARPRVVPGSGGQAAMAELVVRNASNEDVRSIYVSPSFEPRWGRDLLGALWLEQGETATLRSVPAGFYDLRVVDRSGHQKVWSGVYLAPGRAYHLVIDSNDWEP